MWRRRPDPLAARAAWYAAIATALREAEGGGPRADPA